MPQKFNKDLQYYKFCFYGFLKNLEFFEPFLLLIFLEQDLTFLQIGTLYAIREIATNVFEIPCGILSDSLGRRKTLISSFVFYIFSFIIFYFASSFETFALAMVIYAFGDAFRTGTHKAMIFEYLTIKNWQNQKVYYYGHTRSWSQLGSAISAIIAAGIVFITGEYRNVFIFSTIPFFLDLILIITYPKELDGRISKLEGHRFKTNFIKVFKEFVYSFSKKSVLNAIGNLSFYSGYYKSIKDYLQPILKAFALSLPLFLFLDSEKRSSLVIGLVYFIIFLATSFSSRNSGKFSSFFSKLSIPLNITLYAGIGMGILTGIFYNLNMLYLSILFYVLIYIVENLRRPIGISYVADKLDQDILATALSAESQTKSIVAAIFAPLIGFMADYFGIGNAIITISLILLATTPFIFAKEKILKNT